MTSGVTDIRAATPDDPEPVDRLRLDYEARLVRRKVLRCEGGLAVAVDLPRPTELGDGTRLILDDGRHVSVVAAHEALMDVRGDPLARLAWHVGNRHTPCRIEADRLVLRRDPVLKAMLEGLGAAVADIEGPFVPEGGAYGHGRVMGHDHPHD